MTVVPGSPPSVIAVVPSVKANPTAPRALLATTLDPAGHAGVTLAWSTPDLTPEALAAVLLSPSLTLPTLALRPALPVGTYTFTLTASVRGEALAATAVTLVVNGPPRNGFVTVTPDTGIAMTTEFDAVAGGWVDDVEVGARAGSRVVSGVREGGGEW